MKIVLKVVNQHLTVTFLLEYLDLFTTCMKTMLGTYYSFDIMFNALPSLKILGVHLQITHFLLNICVLATRNACNKDFHSFIVLGDEFNI